MSPSPHSSSSQTGRQSQSDRWHSRKIDLMSCDVSQSVSYRSVRGEAHKVQDRSENFRWNWFFLCFGTEIRVRNWQKTTLTTSLVLKVSVQPFPRVLHEFPESSLQFLFIIISLSCCVGIQWQICNTIGRTLQSQHLCDLAALWVSTDFDQQHKVQNAIVHWPRLLLLCLQLQKIWIQSMAEGGADLTPSPTYSEVRFPPVAELDKVTLRCCEICICDKNSLFFRLKNWCNSASNWRSWSKSKRRD